jgi:NAD(P)-dependent dehydrogenase (short-subunit alcohol dehydrogenase family)
MQNEAMKLQGKHAIVTGGSQGIGRGIIDAFIAQGATVVTCGRSPSPGNLPEGCDYHVLDVADPQAVKTFANTQQPPDILGNNAGVQVEKNVTESTDDDWELVMGANARGVFNMCRAFIPVMQKGGAIINIGSISGNVADPSMALYNASKAFVHGLTRSIAVDHGPQIRCNAICPGWIETGMLEAGFATANNPKAAMNDALGRHPVRRFGKPADIAAMAVWLASDDAAFATGQLFTIDGGMTASSPLNPGLF